MSLALIHLFRLAAMLAVAAIAWTMEPPAIYVLGAVYGALLAITLTWMHREPYDPGADGPRWLNAWSDASSIYLYVWVVALALRHAVPR